MVGFLEMSKMRVLVKYFLQDGVVVFKSFEFVLLVHEVEPDHKFPVLAADFFELHFVLFGRSVLEDGLDVAKKLF